MTVFVDTSAIFALLDASDPNHADVASTLASIGGAEELVTHNYIHVEAEALVRRRLGREAAADLVDRVLPGMTTVWVDAETHAGALEALRTREWRSSLVDEVSFVVMRRMGITEALAYDADYAAAGFGAPRRADPSAKRLSDAPAAYGSPASDLVSVSEIAQRSRRSISTVQSWRRRDKTFPPAAARLAAGPIWNWSDVDAWIQSNRPRRRAPRKPGIWWDSPEVNAEIAADV